MFYLSICFFFLFSVLFLFLFQPKPSLFVNFLVLFRFPSKICIWVFVWWKTGVFAQVGSTLIFSLTICTVFLCTLWGLQGKWVPLGNSLAFTKLHKNRFLGPFRIPTQTFTFIVTPHQHISLFKNQAPSKVKCHRTAFCRDQTVTERPVRPRVSAPTIMYIRTYVYLCHTPVTY